MTKDGVTNGYLDEIGKKILGTTFAGVFPCDLFPKLQKKNMKKYHIIFNLSKHNEEGTHFVCMSLHKKTLYYFDPLGDPLSNPYIKCFISMFPKSHKIVDLQEKIQHDASSLCGFFCLGYCMAKEKNISNKKFFSFFDKTQMKKNDVLISKFIVRNIKK